MSSKNYQKVTPFEFEIKSPPFTHVTCNELVAKVLE